MNLFGTDNRHAYFDKDDDNDNDDNNNNNNNNKSNQWHYSRKWSLASSRILSYSSQFSSFYPAVSNISFSPIIIRNTSPLFSGPFCSSFPFCVVIRDNFWHSTINQTNHMSCPYIYNDNNNDNCNCILFDWCSSLIIDKQLNHDQYEKITKKKQSVILN